MAEITSITPQKKDKTRCNVEVDGRFYCGMKLETVIKARLKVGSAVTKEELGAIQLESEKTTALDKALTHISHGMKTEKDVRDFLKSKGYLEDVSGYVIERMKHHGFLDDLAYAKAYAESAGKRKGARLIALELRQKGVAPDLIEEALAPLESDGAAKASLEKYLRGKAPDRATLQKAYRHLLSRGFDSDTVKEALSSLKEGYDED